METPGMDVVEVDSATGRRPACACSWKSDFVAAGVLLVLAMVAVLPGWLPGRVYVPAGAVERKDERGQRSFDYLIGSAEAGALWRAGNIPLWNSNRGVGVPIIGDGRTGIFDPLTMLHALWPPGRAWAINAMLKLWIAGFGAWLLAGRYQLPTDSRLLTGIAYMLGGAMIAQVHLTEGSSAMLLPWAIWATLKLADQVTPPRLFIATAVLSFTFLSGQLGGAFLVCIACLMVVVTHVGFGVNYSSIQRVVEWLPSLLIAMIVSAAITGAQWVPLTYNLTYYTGPDTFEFGSLASRPAGLAIWTGILTPILACGFAHRTRHRAVWAWYAIGAAALLFAVGLPGFSSLVELKIGGRTLSHSSQMLMLLMLTVALLAGFGLDGLRTPSADANPNPAPLRKSASWLVLVGVELLIAAIAMHQGISAEAWEKVVGGRSSATVTAGRPPTRWEISSMLAHAGEARLTPVPGRVAQWRKHAVNSMTPVSDTIAKVWFAPSAQLENSIESIARKLTAQQDGAGVGLLIGSNYAADADFSSLTVRAAGYGDKGELEVVSQSPSRLQLNVTNSHGYIVWAEAYTPGWTADTITTTDYASRPGPVRRGSGNFVPSVNRTAEPTIAHRPTVLAPAFGVLRAVPIQATSGAETELVIEYFPRGWKRGLMLSAAGGVLLLIVVGWSLFPKIE